MLCQLVWTLINHAPAKNRKRKTHPGAFLDRKVLRTFQFGVLQSSSFQNISLNFFPSRNAVFIGFLVSFFLHIPYALPVTFDITNAPSPIFKTPLDRATKTESKHPFWGLIHISVEEITLKNQSSESQKWVFEKSPLKFFLLTNIGCFIYH